ncbi:PREDICTED: transmembrane protein 258 [Chrysochloris asiatica]|uniref:Dolichyl-diphosphooligosaccharide-protein glycosyltransferase subunit TMEM258 n=1 Tax=Chrysochloris asiatica TaxID=185453 RepID=A0A9B0U673_CHRAS|nr:PREDICTED: transmembrane protein 258 [Chrysochloris asiatica]
MDGAPAPADVFFRWQNGGVPSTRQDGKCHGEARRHSTAVSRELPERCADLLPRFVDIFVTCHASELEAMSRYTSPVNPAVFPHLTVVLLAIGMFFTAWFFVYEVTSTKYTRDIYKELLISLVASLFMGFGVLFLLLWVGIYV